MQLFVWMAQIITNYCEEPSCSVIEFRHPHKTTSFVQKHTLFEVHAATCPTDLSLLETKSTRLSSVIELN